MRRWASPYVPVGTDSHEGLRHSLFDASENVILVFHDDREYTAG